MRLRVRTDRWTTVFFAALGLAPACGGAITDNSGTSGSGGGSSGSGSSSSTVATTGTSGAGTGAGGGTAFPCLDPQPVGSPETGYVRCQGGNMHRPTKAVCPTSVPRPAPVTDGFATFPKCTKDSDCPPKTYCEQGPVDFYCQEGCTVDSDCEAGMICLCGEPMGTCTYATCTVDAECGTGLLCSSYILWAGCPTIAFSCQKPADECAAASDCSATQDCTAGPDHHVCTVRGCTVGRPFLVGDEDRLAPLDARTDWLANQAAPDTSLLGDGERSLLAAAWARIGQMEHASVAAFARFTLHLMSLGAPADLVERSNAALVDETLHAKLAFAIASGYAGRAIGPGPLAIEGAFASSRWQDILVTTIREGCIGETVAAIEAAEALEYAEDPEVRRALTRIADDELRHAELAWRFVGWVVARWGVEARDVARAEFARAHDSRIEEAAAPATREERVLLAGGIVPARLRELVRSEALSRVVRACANGLLAAGENGTGAAMAVAPSLPPQAA